MPGKLLTTTATVGGKVINVALLETIDIQRLANKEPGEIEKLVNAAQSTGLFYIDLRTEPLILADLSNIYALSEKYFDQAQEVKVKDAREDQKPTQDRGYKKSDCDETYEISRDELNSGIVALPKIFQENLSLVKRFSESCYAVSKILLASLSDGLQLKDGDRFENSHRDGEPSDTGFKVVYEPTLPKLADVGENLHTDGGTLTTLFYDLWGLHSDLQGGKQWGFAAPKEGCALVNVADSLQRLSGNRLHSPQHRVTQPADGFAKRYFVAHFLRPEDALKEAWAKV